MNTLRSWIIPKLQWEISEAEFACIVRGNDREIVSLLAKGSLTVEAPSRDVAEGYVRLGMPYGEVGRACLIWLINGKTRWDCRSTFFLHDLRQLADGEFLLLLGGLAPRGGLSPRLRDLREPAAMRLEQYEEELADLDRHREELLTSFKAQPGLTENHKSYGRTIWESQQPTPTEPSLADLNLHTAPVVLVNSEPTSAKGREAVLRAVEESGRQASRTGVYNCVSVKLADWTMMTYVDWSERGASTPALEIKSALEHHRRSVFKKPRAGGVHPPRFDVEIAVAAISVGGAFDVGDFSDGGILEDVSPALAKEGKEGFEKHGFESIAWYQSFHSFETPYWGIYFDAKRLDAYAASLAHDLPQGPQSRRLAALLAFHLTMAHELFHARVEFAAGWLELTSRKRQYLNYVETVYRVLQFTPDWREESLANWTAHQWLLENLDGLKTKGLVSDPELVRGVVEDHLDFSPEGYRAWPDGDQPSTWDKLANEIADGKPRTKDRLASFLPLGGVLRDPTIFDLRANDVPIYFVGRGDVADAFFSSPCRREIHRVLQHYGYQVLPGRGKGSHEVWSSPDGDKRFILPARDPLSTGVFHNLLKFFNWSKHQYLQEIRPQI